MATQLAGWQALLVLVKKQPLEEQPTSKCAADQGWPGPGGCKKRVAISVLPGAQTSMLCIRVQP